MPKMLRRKGPVHRRPVLFIDTSGEAMVRRAVAYMGKSVEAETPESLSLLPQERINKDTVYCAECKSGDLLELMEKIAQIGLPVRIGVNVSSEDSHLLEYLMSKDVSIMMAADRSMKEWCEQFEKAEAFQTYMDPYFQPYFMERYRSLHRQQEQPKEQQMQLEIDKARTVLSEAEIRILEKIIEGKSNRRIAEECYLAVATVNNHVSHLTKKMKANDRTHTIKRAIEEGWINITQSTDSRRY